MMRKTALAMIALLSVSGVAEAGLLQAFKTPSLAQSHVVQVQDFNSSSQRSNQNQNNGWDRRQPRFVCVITPPDSAERSRPYVCPVQQGRVGGRCRCSGVVGSGNIDTAW
ncbi:hypothetical protein [uncultured Agrobacterium sp.]|uniref:hypothetical protein n=1 Tax=uncultured Agrobacterium sp. TaxID=157277 RepID=UPI0025F0B9BB|nr:hypothetical protein [uncultured Agrobacterium sp.]